MMRALVVALLAAACTGGEELAPGGAPDAAPPATELHFTGTLVDARDEGISCGWHTEWSLDVVDLDGVAVIPGAVPPVPCTEVSVDGAYVAVSCHRIRYGFVVLWDWIEFEGELGGEAEMRWTTEGGPLWCSALYLGRFE